jgi:hypothetical protein
MGFSEVIHLTPEEVHERHLKDRHDGLTVRRGEQLTRALHEHSPPPVVL